MNRFVASSAVTAIFALIFMGAFVAISDRTHAPAPRSAIRPSSEPIAPPPADAGIVLSWSDPHKRDDGPLNIVPAQEHWSIEAHGARRSSLERDADKCPRCRRVLLYDPTSGLSGALKFRNDEGRLFFDGCVYCLEEAIAAAGSRR